MKYFTVIRFYSFGFPAISPGLFGRSSVALSLLRPCFDWNKYPLFVLCSLGKTGVVTGSEFWYLSGTYSDFIRASSPLICHTYVILMSYFIRASSPLLGGAVASGLSVVPPWLNNGIGLNLRGGGANRPSSVRVQLGNCPCFARASPCKFGRQNLVVSLLSSPVAFPLRFRANSLPNLAVILPLFGGAVEK